MNTVQVTDDDENVYDLIVGVAYNVVKRFNGEIVVRNYTVSHFDHRKQYWIATYDLGDKKQFHYICQPRQMIAIGKIVLATLPTQEEMLKEIM